MPAVLIAFNFQKALDKERERVYLTDRLYAIKFYKIRRKGK